MNLVLVRNTESETRVSPGSLLAGLSQKAEQKPFTQRASLHVSRAPLHARALSHVLPEEDQEHLDMFWGGGGVVILEALHRS